MVLDIGCGTRKIEADAVGIDISPDSAADHVWNLDVYPWPLEDNRFTRIHMSHVIEHLDDPMRAMAEVHRVARDGADVFIVTPHFSSHNSYVDPTHKRHLAAGSFVYLTGQDFPSFRGAPFAFEIVRVELTFGGNLVLDNLGRALAGMSLRWYERHAAWVFPAQDIRCHLRARKS
ncbi:MAG TPA: class I SAM-dependent methyltransferase [Verrucomicrobiae bacterium]|nr:class I SAM-dependent methyltransferase [Verrucomicrobiae bacterium]